MRGPLGITVFALVVLYISGSIFVAYVPHVFPEVQHVTKMKFVEQLDGVFASIPLKHREQAADMIVGHLKGDAIRMIIYSVIVFFSGLSILLRRHIGRYLLLGALSVAFTSNVVGLTLSTVFKKGFVGIWQFCLVSFIMLYIATAYLTNDRVKEHFK